MLMRAEINFNQKGNSIGGIFIFFGKIIFNSKINILIISLTVVCPNTQGDITTAFPQSRLSSSKNQKRAQTLCSYNDITLLKNPSQNQKPQQAGSTHAHIGRRSLDFRKHVTWAARVSFLRILPEIGGFCGDRSSRVHTSTKIFGKLLGKQNGSSSIALGQNGAKNLWEGWRYTALAKICHESRNASFIQA